MNIKIGKKSLVLTSIMVFTLLLMNLYTSEITQASVRAQERIAPSSMRALIESLNEMVQADGTFTFTLQLHTPFVGDRETIIHIPANDGETSFERTIFSVGEDHVCFQERNGQYQSVRCTPYSNIAEVAYQS